MSQQMIPAPEQINFLNTRSFYAAFMAALTGLAQMTDANFLIPLANLLQMFGLIDSADEFIAALTPLFTAIGPVITALLGIWAYVERLMGKKKVVMGRASS